jgi:hydrogenase-4 component B
VNELLLILAPGLPALLAVLWPLGPLRRFLLVLAPWAPLPALVLALLPGVEGTGLVLSGVLVDLRLEVDAVGRAFLLLTSVLWLAGGLFARSYHARDPRRDVFLGFFVLTMAGNLGLAVAGDILSFYFFFAVMTFAAYGLVVHRGDGEARRAGRVYLVMAVAGELGILAGLFLLGWGAAGVPSFGMELSEAWGALERGGAAGIAALLLLSGFAVKAGLVPLHLWLPLAHPVAPTAASALLSGAMIKAGLLAWIRYLPLEAGLPALGGGLMTVGVAAAFYGVAVGVAQDDAKTVLAYSSVSQMGYMAVGVGLLVRAPEWAPAALFAVILYAMHHGVAKAALFLAVGVADRAGRTASGVRSGLVLAVCALPALALAGAPLTSGARAKGALKAALESLGGAWYPTLDPLLLLAAGGTALLMARFLVTLRLRRVGAEDGTAEGAGAENTLPMGLLGPWGALVVLSVVGPVWLTLAYPAPPGVALPGVREGMAEALAPVAFGGLLAWTAWRHPALLGGAAAIRIPAGDLLLPIESAARKGIRAFAPVLSAPEALGRRFPSPGLLDAPAGEPEDPESPAAEGVIFGLFLALLGAILLLVLIP